MLKYTMKFKGLEKYSMQSISAVGFSITNNDYSQSFSVGSYMYTGFLYNTFSIIQTVYFPPFSNVQTPRPPPPPPPPQTSFSQ